jgi:hypothetical protein
MTDVSAPEIAVLLVADSRPMIRKVLRYYAAQEGARRLEIVVTALRGADISQDWLRAQGFRHATVVRTDDPSLARAEKLAMEASTAPLVIFAQAHAYPQPGLIRNILSVHEAGDWTVIGPAMANSNPASATSRAAMQVNYGPWWNLGVRGPRPGGVPGHNSAYRKSALVSLGEDIENVLPAGDQLQVELKKRGHALFYVPEAQMAIVNVSRARSFLADMHRQGRLFAGERRLPWPFWRRLAYAAGSPLIPAVRLSRIVSQAGGAGRTLWSELPALVCGLLVSAAGEFAGYLFGKNAWAESCETSFHRLAYVSERDARADADESTWPHSESTGNGS